MILRGTGIALSAMMIYGRRLWPGIFLGALANRAVVADWTRTFPALTEAAHAGWAAAHPARALTEGLEADRIGLQIARAFVGQI